jgi:hypothetical protein
MPAWTTGSMIQGPKRVTELAAGEVL